VCERERERASERVRESARVAFASVKSASKLGPSEPQTCKGLRRIQASDV
jgi:hypothetical protein